MHVARLAPRDGSPDVAPVRRRRLRGGARDAVRSEDRSLPLRRGAVRGREVSERDKTAEVGFIFDTRRQGKGLATEAAGALIDLVFTSAGFHRVIGRTEARNAASARVLEKLGMRLEAHFVENEWVKGEWQSELVYAVLDREWTA